MYITLHLSNVKFKILKDSLVLLGFSFSLVFLLLGNAVVFVKELREEDEIGNVHEKSKGEQGLISIRAPQQRVDYNFSSTNHLEDLHRSDKDTNEIGEPPASSGKSKIRIHNRMNRQVHCGESTTALKLESPSHPTEPHGSNVMIPVEENKRALTK